MSYIRTGLNLTELQKESTKKGYMNKQPVSIKLTASQLSGNNHLGLTKAQYKKVTSAGNEKTGVSLIISQRYKLRNKERVSLLILLTYCREIC